MTLGYMDNSIDAAPPAFAKATAGTPAVNDTDITNSIMFEAGLSISNTTELAVREGSVATLYAERNNTQIDFFQR
jgi:hypothetical protein